MEVGTRIYYTGDRANMSSTGTITAVHPPHKYGPASVDISYDESRFEGDSLKSRLVPLQAFEPGSGRRFWLLADWENKEAEALAKWMS